MIIDDYSGTCSGQRHDMFLDVANNTLLIQRAQSNLLDLNDCTIRRVRGFIGLNHANRDLILMFELYIIPTQLDRVPLTVSNTCYSKQVGDAKCRTLSCAEPTAPRSASTPIEVLAMHEK